MGEQGLPRVSEARATVSLIVCFGAVFLVTFGLALTETPGFEGLVASLWNLSAPVAFEQTGGLVLTRVWLDGEWWRLLTAGFVHGSWLHLGLNGWALWTVGQWTERVWGPWRQLLLFLVSSVGGCLASLAWAEAPIVVGASAGIFGVAAALVVGRRFGSPGVQAALYPVAGGRLAVWLVLWLIVGWQLPMLANAGHLGGAVVGLLAGFWLTRTTLGGRVVSGVFVALVFLGLALAAAQPVGRPNFHAFVGFALLERGDSVLGGRELARALSTQPDDPTLQNAVAYGLALEGERLELAEELSLASLRAQPDQADFLDTLGWVYCRMGRVEAGLDRLRAAEASSTVSIPEVREHLRACASAAVP